MVADASIYGILQQQKDPLDSVGKAMNLRALMEESKLRGIQTGKLEGDIADEQNIKDYLKGLQPGQEADVNRLAGIAPKFAMDYATKSLANKKAQAETGKITVETQTKAAELHRNQLADVNDPQTAATWVQAGYADPHIGPVLQRGGTLEQAIARIPTDPAQFNEWKQRNGLGIQKFIEMQNTNTEHALNRATTERGQDITDRRAAATLAQGKEKMERDDWQFDSDRGLMVNKRTGVSRPVTAGDNTPIGPSPTNLKHQAELNSLEGQRQGALQSYDTAISTMDRMLKHPGFEGAVGLSLSKAVSPFWAMPASERANFEKELEAFKAQTFLPMVQALRGMGALSNAEGDKLSAAVGALSTNMSEKAFKESGDRIKADLTAAKARFERQGQVPGSKTGQQSAKPGTGIKFLGFEQ